MPPGQCQPSPTEFRDRRASPPIVLGAHSQALNQHRPDALQVDLQPITGEREQIANEFRPSILAKECLEKGLIHHTLAGTFSARRESLDDGEYEGEAVV